MITGLLIVLCVIGYFLIGVIYLLAYMLAMQPEPRETQLGLIVVFWWLWLLVGIILPLCLGLGTIGRSLSARLKPNKAA